MNSSTLTARMIIDSMFIPASLHSFAELDITKSDKKKNDGCGYVNQVLHIPSPISMLNPSVMDKHRNITIVADVFLRVNCEALTWKLQ